MADEPWRVPDHDPDHRQDAKQRAHPAQTPQKKTARDLHYGGHTRPLTRFVAFVVGMSLLLLGLSLAFPVSGGVDPYLVRSMIILFIFGGAAAFWSRSSLMRLLKIAGVWALIIVTISGFYLYRSDFGDRFMTALDPAGVVSTGDGLIVQRNRDGHFWLRARFNGVPLLLMVDTGASNVVLSPEDAKKIGLRTDRLNFSGRADTANGSVSFARATITSVGVGDQTFFDVPVTVNGAEMQGSLLGMALLDRFASVEFRGDTLILRP